MLTGRLVAGLVARRVELGGAKRIAARGSTSSSHAHSSCRGLVRIRRTWQQSGRSACHTVATDESPWSFGTVGQSQGSRNVLRAASRIWKRVCQW